MERMVYHLYLITGDWVRVDVRRHNAGSIEGKITAYSKGFNYLQTPEHRHPTEGRDHTKAAGAVGTITESAVVIRIISYEE